MQNDPSTFNPIGAWDHDQFNVPYQFGAVSSYRMAAAFLDLPGTIVEDWGCGSAFARQFFTKARYVGVDGSPSKWCDDADDLRTRDSHPDGILLRHVLEHNPQWETVLENALRCFGQRLVLVTFLAWTPATEIRQNDPDPIPCVTFCRADVDRLLAGFTVREERVEGTDETVFYVERVAGLVVGVASAPSATPPPPSPRPPKRHAKRRPRRP